MEILAERKNRRQMLEAKKLNSYKAMKNNNQCLNNNNNNNNSNKNDKCERFFKDENNQLLPGMKCYG